jgi:hypothetical protein
MPAVGHRSERTLGAEEGGYLALEYILVSVDEGDVSVLYLAVAAFPAELTYGLDDQEQSVHTRMIVRETAPAGVHGELSSW